MMTDVFTSLAGLMGTLGGWAMALAAAFNERFGVLAPVVAGAATAVAVAIVMAIYYRTGNRSPRDILRHGVATIVVIGLLAFVASDMRHAAPDYLGINPSKPVVESEIRLPKTTAPAVAPNDIFAIRYRVM
jgi:hypothetical protein